MIGFPTSQRQIEASLDHASQGNVHVGDSLKQKLRVDSDVLGAFVSQLVYCDLGETTTAHFNPPNQQSYLPRKPGTAFIRSSGCNSSALHPYLLASPRFTQLSLCRPARLLVFHHPLHLQSANRCFRLPPTCFQLHPATISRRRGR